MKFNSVAFQFLLLAASSALAHSDGQPSRIIEVKASTSAERSAIANLGYALEDIRSDRVYIWGHDGDAARIANAGFLTKDYELPQRLLSDPGVNGAFHYHSYDALTADLQALERAHPNLVQLSSLGRSVQNRNIPLMRISGKSVAQAENAQLPVMLYLGCHHAREHLSVEVPLLFAHYLLDNYGKNPDVTRLVDTREIYFAPIVNPDGIAYDFQGDDAGRMWRKNRSTNRDGSYGVDLNRNYGFHWGSGGSSDDPRSDVFMGPQPFSEPETQSVRDFVSSQPRMTTLLTLHSFSELVLYPWGHTENPIGKNGLGREEDRQVFEKMANDISAWNHYKPEQASSLYVASGDTTDWAYGERGIFALTFELSPSSMWDGGFYPGAEAIEPAFQANLKPMLYLLEFANNPHRVQSERIPGFLTTPSLLGISVADFRDALN